MQELLPPSSSVAGLRRPGKLQEARTLAPVAELPVNVTLPIPSCSQINFPVSPSP